MNRDQFSQKELNRELSLALNLNHLKIICTHFEKSVLENSVPITRQNCANPDHAES